jgi:hypothetical protein
MAYWDSKQGKVIHQPSKPCEEYPGWVREDCGCCNGLEWGGTSPEECSSCAGSGVVYRYLESGVFAQYPGGPFLGREIPCTD